MGPAVTINLEEVKSELERILGEEDEGEVRTQVGKRPEKHGVGAGCPSHSPWQGQAAPV